MIYLRIEFGKLLDWYWSAAHPFFFVVVVQRDRTKALAVDKKKFRSLCDDPLDWVCSFFRYLLFFLFSFHIKREKARASLTLFNQVDAMETDPSCRAVHKANELAFPQCEDSDAKIGQAWLCLSARSAHEEKRSPTLCRLRRRHVGFQQNGEGGKCYIRKCINCAV